VLGITEDRHASIVPNYPSWRNRPDPGPRTTVHNPDHKVYPYLSRRVAIKRRDQAWSSDITYNQIFCEFIFLDAAMDRYSRYALSRSLSDGLDGRSCLETLEEALRGGKPEIFNTDQGAQYTARSFAGRLETAGVSESMDGRGRALDNVFVERLWRYLKYEEVYRKDYRSVAELVSGLTSWFRWSTSASRPRGSSGTPSPSMRNRTPSRPGAGARPRPSNPTRTTSASSGRSTPRQAVANR